MTVALESDSSFSRKRYFHVERRRLATFNAMVFSSGRSNSTVKVNGASRIFINVQDIQTGEAIEYAVRQFAQLVAEQVKLFQVSEVVDMPSGSSLSSLPIKLSPHNSERLSNTLSGNSLSPL